VSFKNSVCSIILMLSIGLFCCIACHLYLPLIFSFVFFLSISFWWRPSSVSWSTVCVDGARGFWFPHGLWYCIGLIPTRRLCPKYHRYVECMSYGTGSTLHGTGPKPHPMGVKCLSYIHTLWWVGGLTPPTGWSVVPIPMHPATYDGWPCLM